MQKQNRFRLLRVILEEKEMHTKEEILDELNANGADTNMYQLIDDLQELRANKVPNFHGKPIWKLPDHGIPQPEAYINSASLSDQIKSVNTAGNLIIVHTFPAMADSVAVAIDDTGEKEILGTIAGFDTIFIAVRDMEAASRIADKIRSVIFS